ncbi:hypothetical protein BSKO_06184 [Bryopsis sp. KO-2023]|nr:hypothetical protein BSKO_06184 [Bryopsis sp. KO-2023]
MTAGRHERPDGSSFSGGRISTFRATEKQTIAGAPTVEKRFGGGRISPILRERDGVEQLKVKMGDLAEGKGETKLVLDEAISEIRNVRASLNEWTSVADVEVALRRAEDGLAQKMKVVASRFSETSFLNVRHGFTHEFCLLLCIDKSFLYIQETFNLELENEDANVKMRPPPKIPRTRFSNTPAPWVAKHRKQAAMGLDAGREKFGSRCIENPTSKAAREYLKERYGIPTPLEGDDRARSSPVDPNPFCSVVKGLPVPPSVILPRFIRDDPFETAPTDISSMEIHKGILHLVNRGLLPHYVDIGSTISGGSWVVRTLRAYMHPFEQRFEKRMPTSALEDSVTAQGAMAYKLDVLTPVVMPSRARIGEKTGLNSQHIGGDPASGHGGEGIRKGPREYEELMDAHSLHQIMIRHGVTVDSTPEFLSFHRTYTRIWPYVADLLLQLEGVCCQYAVPIALIDGKTIAEAANATLVAGEPCPMEELLACISNIQEVALILKQPGRRFKGIHGKQEAALMIQAHYRGYRSRSHAPRIDKMRAAAKEIQEAWRLNRYRNAAISKMRKAREERDHKFQLLQDRLLATWPDIQRNHHVVVHVASVSGGNSHKSEQQEILQMARLCDVADTNVDVVYVAAAAVDTEVEGYWRKLLEVGGVEQPANRYSIIHPENACRLPSQMSLTGKLLSSPRALDRIRNFTHGRPAYIVPSMVGDEDISLSVALEIPLLASHPHYGQAVALKSGARAVFQSAGVNTPPGKIFEAIPDAVADVEISPLTPNTSFNIDAAGHLVVSDGLPGSSGGGRRPRNDGFLIKGVAETLVKNPKHRCWSINIDDEVGGRGVAHFNVDEIDAAKGALDRYMVLMGDPMTAHVLGEAADVAIHKVTACLTKSLPKKLTIVRKDVFPNYRAFVKQIRVRGAVLEAIPSSTTGCPSVNIFIEPVGSVFCPAHIPVGNSFPQCSVPHMALYDAAVAIGMVSRDLGIIGHLGISFVVLQEHGQLKMWATNLSPYPTLALTSFQLFDFLTAGEFDPKIGAYLIPDDEESEASFEEKLRRELAVERGDGDGDRDRNPEYIDGLVKESESPVSESTLQRRFYVSLDRLAHPLLQKLQYASFFHCCRVHGMCFDMQDRIGTAFNVADGFATGVLGVLCVGLSPFEAFNELSDVLDFISGQVGGVRKQLGLSSGLTDGDGDAKSFNGIRMTVKYLAERLQTANKPL